MYRLCHSQSIECCRSHLLWRSKAVERPKTSLLWIFSLHITGYSTVTNLLRSLNDRGCEWHQFWHEEVYRIQNVTWILNDFLSCFVSWISPMSQMEGPCLSRSQVELWMVVVPKDESIINTSQPKFSRVSCSDISIYMLATTGEEEKRLCGCTSILLVIRILTVET